MVVKRLSRNPLSTRIDFRRVKSVSALKEQTIYNRRIPITYRYLVQSVMDHIGQVCALLEEITNFGADDHQHVFFQF